MHAFRSGKFGGKRDTHVNRRILAEDLVHPPSGRLRALRRVTTAGVILPHRIDAVIFRCAPSRAAASLLMSGTGKNDEAGLVLAQSLAEGAERVLLIVPKSLIGQWQDELLNLFGIQAREDLIRSRICVATARIVSRPALGPMILR